MKEKKQRHLSKAEQKRLAEFEEHAEELKAQGYVRHDLTIGLVKANIIALLVTILLSVIGMGLYYLIHHRLDMSGFNGLTFFIVFFVLIVVHELIHGFTWSRFTPNHFKDISFGFMINSLTPYCTCRAPLKKGPYILGTAMPLIILGILPMIIGIIAGNMSFLLMGILQSASAMGDVMIIQKVLAFKSSAIDIVYMDHPTEAGLVIFERN